MEMRKVKTSDLPAIRKELLEKQRYVCPISGRDLRGMAAINLCVDHSHVGGHIRAVLPRGINGLEGKVKALLCKFGGLMSTDVAGQAKLLHALADYLMLHRVPQTLYIHPTFKNEVEKRTARNSLARKRYAANKKTS